MQLHLEVDATRLLEALLRFPDELAAEMRPQMGEALAKVATRAVQVHDYNYRRTPSSPRSPRTGSGMLARSVQIYVDPSGLVGEVFLDPGIAAYGRYVHGGFKSWAPDEFLYESMRFNAGAFVDHCKVGIDRALRRLNL